MRSTTPLTLYAEPVRTASILAHLRADSNIDFIRIVRKHDGPWTQLRRLDGTTCFAPGDLSYVDSSSELGAPAEVNAQKAPLWSAYLSAPALLYARPDEESAILALLGSGQLVDVIGTSSDWTELKYPPNTRSFFAYGSVSVTSQPVPMVHGPWANRIEALLFAFVIFGFGAALILGVLPAMVDLPFKPINGAAFALPPAVLSMMALMFLGVRNKSAIVRPFDDNAPGMLLFLASLLINRNSSGRRIKIFGATDFVLARVIMFAILTSAVGAIGYLAKRSN